MFDEEEDIFGDPKEEVATPPPEKAESVKSNDSDEEEPYVKFRRVARAVKLLIQVCHVCKSLLADSVAQEAWFALVDNLAAAAALQKSNKKGRAFITFVPNEKRELVQLSFDVTEYMRHKKAEDYLTDDIRKIMKQRPGTRDPDQIAEVVRCMKGICKAFNEYPLAIQKQICQYSFYDKYRNNRVILRRGLPADGVYFVLSGQLIEKPEGKKQPTEIQAGEKFGEEDLVCGSSRRATVLTKHEVELLFLHRFDYQEIFNMSADSTDPKNLEICRHDVVFQHFPMQKLVENPGTWSVLKYKYGRLIAKDSNEIEWIYVIKTGEARVLKHLEPGKIDVKARRKKIQQTMEEESPFHQKRRILSFIAEGDYLKSSYRPSTYHPSLNRSHATTHSGHEGCLGDSVISSTVSSARLSRNSKSRVTASTPRDEENQEDMQTITTKFPSITLKGGESVEKETVLVDGQSKENEEKISQEEAKEQKKKAQDEGVMLITMDEIKEITDPKRRSTTYLGKFRVGGRNHPGMDKRLPKRPHTEQGVRTRYIHTPRPSIRRIVKEEEESKDLPPFVQIETLHPGQTFGLRSCLELEERGPSVSLISGECEVLAINKKFFMKHCDDAMYSLIRLKAKPFPDQGELVDRLDANMQWEEFKQDTLKDFLRHRVRTVR